MGEELILREYPRWWMIRVFTKLLEYAITRIGDWWGWDIEKNGPKRE